MLRRPGAEEVVDKYLRRREVRGLLIEEERMSKEMREGKTELYPVKSAIDPETLYLGI